MTMTSRPLILVVALLVSLGCGGPQTKNDPAAPGSVKDDQTQVKPATEEASEVKIPADFPADVFIPSGGRPMISGQIAGTRVLTIKYATSSLEQLSQSIQSEMKAGSWTEEAAAVISAESGVCSFRKAERVALYTLTQNGSQVEVAITLTSRP